MKFKIPEIRIPKVDLKKLHHVNDDAPVSYEEVDSDYEEESAASTEASDSEVLDEFEDISSTEEMSEAQPKEKPKSYGMVISEDQLRMVWAGEIGFSLLIVLTSVLIAIVN